MGLPIPTTKSEELRNEVIERILERDAWQWDRRTLESNDVDEAKLNLLLSRVHLDPPPEVMLKYPCLIIDDDGLSTVRADNSVYKKDYRKTLMYVTRDPDCDKLIDALLSLDYCSYDRSAIVDNLYHHYLSIKH